MNKKLFLLTLMISVIRLSTVSASGLIKGPYLIYPGSNTSMTVLWQLDESDNCQLQWGISSDDYSIGSVSTSEYGNKHQHKYTITDLIPGNRYFYQLVIGSNTYQGSFYAAPPHRQFRCKIFNLR
ncbi:MAG: hypothetical protein OMM_10558 [Candidatus Magnetoglobus multicellularis str. Araruama]|uniref:Purple acid phosphatase N-terminal domain-containing protein n=1 Tax=Candidatus Magnetoglobus multicellularis str. Araruama TaxID=890399 RepID=A0A1V1P0R3_9BACT|nr:MAG: hypothetical protein OMM_10558 [Candidatus Magnetoglobus multicellularis str. Araruama]